MNFQSQDTGEKLTKYKQVKSNMRWLIGFFFYIEKQFQLHKMEECDHNQTQKSNSILTK